MKEAETKVVKIVKNRKMKKFPGKGGNKDKKQRDDKGSKGKKSNQSEDNGEGDDDLPEPVAPKVQKEIVVQQRRDFSTDLMGYISAWNYRETSGVWKFNKILQTWALDHCFDKKRIDANVFKALMPYLLSIKGNSVDRLLAQAEEIITKSIENDEEDEDNEDNGENSTKNEKEGEETSAGLSLKRAIKIKFEFSKLAKP